MRPKPAAPKSIAILAHPDIPDALTVAGEVGAFLHDRGIKVSIGSLQDEGLRSAVRAKDFDLLIALGGDGTMLRAGHLCAPVDVPLLGINIGHFGFLAELAREDWKENLPNLLAGKFRFEARMMLKACCVNGDEEKASFDVINDVVVARGQYVRPIEVEAYLDGTYIISYVADGLIAATATGSTAYALAVGGPILPPEIRNILLVPIAPHLSVDRAIVLSEGASVLIKVRTKHEAVLSMDGHEPVHLSSGDSVRITANKKTLYMVRFADPSHFYRNLTSHMERNPVISKQADVKSN